ncbi:hypothetical protein U1Q18_004141 [Sarracenia purpurea var. burkii]
MAVFLSVFVVKCIFAGISFCPSSHYFNRRIIFMLGNPVLFGCALRFAAATCPLHPFNSCQVYSLKVWSGCSEMECWWSFHAVIKV